MLIRKLRMAALLAAAGAVAFTSFEIPAQAGALPIGQAMPQGISTDNGAGFQLAATQAEKRKKKVANQQKKKRWAYSSKRHGPRYRNRTVVHKYYYGGYYYSQPWWTLTPGLVIVID